MKRLRALSLEDSDDDFALVCAELAAAGYDADVRRVETESDLRAALDEGPWDVVLSDFKMPAMDAMRALAIVLERGVEAPFVIVSGSIGEERAVDALKAGAADYVMKERLEKLAPVVERALNEAQVRRERRAAYAALEHAVQARDEFLSIASHELKTPLTTLQLQLHAALKVLRGGGHVDEAIVRAEGAARSAARLADLVDRLLDITKVSSGALEIADDPVDLAELARDVVGQLAEVCARAGCIATVRGPDDLVGRWDRERLRIALANLVTNACKFGAGKPIDVLVSDDGAVVRVRVADQGIGVEAADQTRIFERFGRAVSERHYGGFGMGLWLTKRIVDAHGGTIDVDSGPGRGACFTITLPKRA